MVANALFHSLSPTNKQLWEVQRAGAQEEGGPGRGSTIAQLHGAESSPNPRALPNQGPTLWSSQAAFSGSLSGLGESLHYPNLTKLLQ